MIPYRGGGLDFKSTNEFIENDNLQTDNYQNFNKYKFDNIIFTMGGKPFIDDYSAIITKNILSNQNNNLKNIILISAFGAGETLQNANLGIKLMNNLYLKSVYEAKNQQETLINEYKKTTIMLIFLFYVLKFSHMVKLNLFIMLNLDNNLLQKYYKLLKTHKSLP